MEPIYLFLFARFFLFLHLSRVCQCLGYLQFIISLPYPGRSHLTFLFLPSVHQSPPGWPISFPFSLRYPCAHHFWPSYFWHPFLILFILDFCKAYCFMFLFHTRISLSCCNEKATPNFHG